MYYASSIQQDNTLCNKSLNIHAFSRVQGGDISELPPYSVDLTPIDADCSIVKRHVSRMQNIKDRHF